MFGIFPNWLNFGEGSPFFSSEPMCLYATDYLSKIRELSPETVYFIRASSEAGDSGILLKISDFKFTYFPKTWPISSHVGSTGQSQIFEFYKTIIALQAVTPSVRCQGRIIEQTDFWDLFGGRVFAGSVIEYHENQWGDDFTDIYREYPGAVDYEESYGKEFLKAQDIVKYMLEKTRAKSV